MLNTRHWKKCMWSCTVISIRGLFLWLHSRAIGCWRRWKVICGHLVFRGCDIWNPTHTNHSTHVRIHSITVSYGQWNVKLHTEVVQVDRFKGAGGFVEMVVDWTLKVKRIRLSKQRINKESVFDSSIKKSTNVINFYSIIQKMPANWISFSHPWDSPEEVEDDTKNNDHYDDQYQDHITYRQREPIQLSQKSFWHLFVSLLWSINRLSKRYWNIDMLRCKRCIDKSICIDEIAYMETLNV